MDKRCPRKLPHFPATWCPQAVIRLRAIRNAGRPLTEEEEDLMPGCKWHCSSQCANYCFFAYVEKVMLDKPLTDMEIAALLSITIEDVRKLDKSGSAKIRENEELRDYLE